MKVEEVVGILESGRNICKMTAVGHSLSWVLTDYGREALTIAIGLLEKQIPKPPEYKVNEKYPTLGRNYYCQECGVMFTDWENYPTNYCGNCGQALEVRNER
jgi:hypothetical protein